MMSLDVYFSGTQIVFSFRLCAMMSLDVYFSGTQIVIFHVLRASI